MEKKKKIKKKKKKSLAKRIRHIIFFVAIFIFAVSTLLNWLFLNFQSLTLLWLYGESVISNVGTLCSYADGFESYTASVLDTYHNIPEEVRANPDSDEYRSYFKQYEDDIFYLLFTSFTKESMDSSFLKDFILATYDEETSALVCLLNPDFPDNEFTEQDDINSAFTGPMGGWVPITLEEYSNMISTDRSGLKWTVDNNIRNDQSFTLAKTIQNMEGEAIGVAIIVIPEALITAAAVVFLIIYFVALGLIILIIVLISRAVLRKRLTDPINKISKAAETYADKKCGRITDPGPVFSSLNIHTRDELEDLSIMMAEMETDISIYEDDLASAAAKEERIKAELDVGTQIQTNMLPSPVNAFPDRDDFKIYASMKPAREVGGDFYDFFLIDEDHLGLVIADVSGKGIPAALFMMSSMNLINNLGSIGLSPADVLMRANEKLCASNQIDMFVTVWFGILDLRNGQLTAANAGHEYPAIRQPNQDFELLHDKHGFVVGGMEGVRYKEYTITLEPGATLFVYTDGVPEATNKNDELYGTDRMIRALNRVKNYGPTVICRGIHDDVEIFVEDAPQFDDLTMLCLQYQGRYHT